MAKFFGTKRERQLSFEAVSFEFKRSTRSTPFPKSAYKEALIPYQWFDHHASWCQDIFFCITIHICMWLYRISVCCHSDAPNEVLPFHLSMFFWLSTSPGCCNHRPHQIQCFIFNSNENREHIQANAEKPATKTCSSTSNTIPVWCHQGG